MDISKDKIGNIGMVASLLFTALAIVISSLFIFIFNNDRSFEATDGFDTYKAVDQTFEFKYPEGYGVDDANSLIFDESNNILEAENPEEYAGTYATFNTIPPTLSIENGCDDAREVISTGLGLGDDAISNVESFTIAMNNACKYDYQQPSRGTAESLIIVENRENANESKFFVLTSPDRESQEYQDIMNIIYTFNYL